MTKEYISKYRTWMLEYFLAHKDECLTARDIYTAMCHAGMSLNLTTVYRNLDRLEIEGHVAKQKDPHDEEAVYRYVDKQLACESHLHLYCEKCGKVMHLNCGFMNEIRTHLMEEHGFVIDCGHSMLTGICEECRKKEEGSC